MYHFVDLNDAEKLQRRQLLDHYSFIAQISGPALVLILHCIFAANSLGRRWSARKDVEAPNSPHLKYERLGHSLGLRSWRVNVRTANWWLGEDFRVTNVHLGTRGQVLLALTWTVWLLWLCFAQTGEDYLHLTKRFGIVAASQLPLHYLLSLKTPYSPIQLLTRSSHETVNIYHQLLGRIVTFLLYLHATFYLSFYVQKSLLASKLQEAYVLCGIAGILALTAIGTTALAPVRHWSYRVFYTTHVILATALLPVLFFHVSHIRIYLYEVAAIHAANVITRSLSSTSVSATIKSLPNTSVLEISIPRSQPLRHYHPAQHAYLSLPSHPASRTLRSNPFTLASLPQTDSNLRFYARILTGNTSLLANHATPHAHHQERQITLEGPYGRRTHPDTLLARDRILLVAGGIGGTFLVPLYRQLLADLSPSPGSHRRGKVEFIWAVRNVEDASWALPEDARERVGFLERAKVFVTGGGSTSSIAGSSSSAVAAAGWEGGDDDIELEERKNLLSSSQTSREFVAGKEGHQDIRYIAGRPDLRRVVDATFSHSTTERVAVLVCGPKSLSRSLRKEVGRWVMQRGREVWFWEESFGL